LAYTHFMQKSIDEVNKRAETDNALQDLLSQYEGRTVSLHIFDDANYVVSISKAGVSLVTPKDVTSEDMYIETDIKTVKKLMNQEIDPLKIASMVFFGKIKIKNIGTKEIDFVKRIL
jgi:hypothetical protein